jgi:hypothetical protein
VKFDYLPGSKITNITRYGYKKEKTGQASVPGVQADKLFYEQIQRGGREIGIEKILSLVPKIYAS